MSKAVGKCLSSGHKTDKIYSFEIQSSRVIER